MADLQFSRNTKVYLKQGSNIWEIPVLDGYSFSQATNASEITLNEMSNSNGDSRRARQMFTDSYAPAEWSFSSYVRPNTDGCVEEALWANFVAANAYVAGTDTWSGGGVTKSSPTTTFDFDDSNKTTLGTFELYFVLGACGVASESFTSTDQSIYKIDKCVVNTASIDFDIDGIATINWSGFGKIISEEASFDAATGQIDTNTGSSDNFIRNRLTSLTVDADHTILNEAGDGPAFPGSDDNGTYTVTLTGGNITFENNITYLTPETLCTINQPLEHVTGTRSVSGNFTCYLDGVSGGSNDLFEDIIEATNVVTNSFSLTFSVGGTSTANPRMVVTMPNCHLEVPAHSIEDVISVDTTFHALPSTVSQTDEATIAYIGAV